jgi:hypothetical protein
MVRHGSRTRQPTIKNRLIAFFVMTGRATSAIEPGHETALLLLTWVVAVSALIYRSVRMPWVRLDRELSLACAQQPVQIECGAD